ncbi:MAG: hypothetical protein HYV27_18910 [Candidatus Hydrogenedentes bacterium]|nr:hypothetical protein [Candidatus Hydrogenedentota bacterium]
MPQPIDPFTELARMSAAERIQQIADRASLAAQARLSSEVTQSAVTKETQVQQSRAKSEEVDEALKRKAPFVGRRRKREQDGEGEEGDAGKAAHTFYNEHEKTDVVEDRVGIDFDVSI